jgi:ABC-type multidrug transport system fused ATPase/permease subunit
MLDKIRIITDATDRKNLFLLFILLLIVTFLELLGLGSIPIFAMVILDPQSLSEKIPLVNNYGFIENIEANDLIYFMSIVLVVIFIIKNLFIAFVNYFNGKLIQRVRGNLTNNLFKSYLHANYEFHIKKILLI